MSANLMPELMELDSYWRRAVEDAICDTLKGEKRLHYALKNRKKIYQKLGKLGLKAAVPQLRFASRPPAESDSRDDECASDNSASSLEDTPQEASKSAKSDSGSRNYTESPSDSKYKSPDRPLLGDGSLEKMKKSHNSFNCEPMGTNIRGRQPGDDGGSDFEKDEDGRFEVFPLDKGEANKKIHWLHVREDSDFGSDSDSSCHASSPKEEDMDAADLGILDDLKFSLKGRRSSGVERGDGKVKKTRGRLSGGEGGLGERLALALAKRKIVNEERGGVGSSLGGRKIEIRRSKARTVGRRRRRGDLGSSAFIQVYLEVYRELFNKCSLKEIASEAARRWWCMTGKQKTRQGRKKLSK